MSHDLNHKDTHKPCTKCGAVDVMWVLNYYYCHKCWSKGDHTQPVIIEKQTKKVKT